MCSASADDFQGTDRFSIESRLGAGAFGVVYRAHDRKRGTAVALKTLRHAASDALYRFKQEFRSLADIAHPNLVSLYELFSKDDQWFFTMELVEGANFLAYVRGVRSGEDIDSSGTTERLVSPSSGSTSSPETRSDAARGLLETGPASAADSGVIAMSFDPVRLRSALQQLVEGLHALHETGKLHRDIKPSNVLVTNDGRVVLLDFGLASDLGPDGFLQSVHLVGTPAYMSPEQAAGSAVTAASDWYGVGVILYEALTGIRPFPGEYLDVLVEKQKSEPTGPRELAPSAPEDLDSLCRALLRKDPRDRPSGEEILRLARSAAPKRLEARTAMAARPTPFVGRATHLADLEHAFQRSKEGRTVAVLVRGSSGVGKTALVRHYLEVVIRSEASPIVLKGRCYEQETVPYKALDSLVDALSHYLKRLPEGEAEVLLPRDLLALAKLFPVLRQVEAVALARRRVMAIPDSVEQRRRAFRALRELFARMAERTPVVLFLDDLQWGDADSAALLLELLRPPESPPLLLICCFRVEEASDNQFLKALLTLCSAATPELEIRELKVADLPAGEAEELARALLGAERGPSGLSAAAIARESLGNPFFIDELARHMRADAELEPMPNDGLAGGAVRLDEVIWARVSQLPDDARRLFETVAIAGQPIDRATARRAAALEEDDQPALALLRVRRMVRSSGEGEEDRVEIYHDRIRQTVISRLSPKAKEIIHQRLAFALETSSSIPDPETLAIHYQGAGSKERAAIYAADAAARAAEALAFDRAARLYKLAIELGTTDESVRQSLRAKLGDALVNAGRGAEGAEAYLAAAETADAAHTLELQRRAAEQLLWSGHVDKGLSVLGKVLDRIGMTLPSSPRRALLSFLLRRFQLRLRGLSFRERAVTEIPLDSLTRIDACWSVSTGLSLIDTIRGRDFQTRQLLLALEAGEPYRIARAMATESGYASYLGGWPARRRTQRLVDQATALAERTRQPHAIGLARLNAGISAFMEGRWEAGWELGQKAEEILREQCTGVTWELDVVHVYSLRALFLLGRLREMSERLPKFVKEAAERGDLFAATSLQARHSYVLHLSADDPGKARSALRHAVERWSQQSFYMQHYFQMSTDAEISLYEGSGQAAWKKLRESWRDLERSLLRRAQYFRIESQHLRGRCALAACLRSGLSVSDRERLLRSAWRDARRVRREKTPWADPLARLLLAGVASFRGRAQDALTELAAAEAGFDGASMALHAAASRRCRGLLLGRDEGRALIESADVWMTSERIRNPERMTAMLAPGRWGAI